MEFRIVRPDGSEQDVKILRFPQRVPHDYIPCPPEVTLFDQLRFHYPAGWEPVFQECQPNFLPMLQRIDEICREMGRTFSPSPNRVLEVYRLCHPQNIRLILMAQDPYHGEYKDGSSIANGLSFSTHRGERIQPSLANIFRELGRYYSNKGEVFEMPCHGDLSRWVREEGVFLLNASLTVVRGKPNSHQGLWNSLVIKTLQYIIQCNNKVLFLTMGKPSSIILKELNCQIKSVEVPHPSPVNSRVPFVGCGCFEKVENYFKSIGESPINWRLD